MKIRTREVSGVTILDIQGRFTMGEPANRVRSQIRQRLEQGSRRILLNLGRVSFVDSTGLGVLIEAFNAVASEGGALKLLNLNRQMNELLFITRLATVIDCFTDDGIALASFVSPPKVSPAREWNGHEWSKP